MVEARGPSLARRFVDPAPSPSVPWYRVVEVTADGRGEASPVVVVDSQRAGGGHR